MPDSIMEREPVPALTLTEASADQFFAAMQKRREAEEAQEKKRDRTAGRLHACFLLAGVACFGAGAYGVLRTPPVEPPLFIPFDMATGRTAEPVKAKDAPQALFTEATRQALLQEFITRCEGYIPQTWRSIDYLNCMIMAAPAEQRRREADIGPNGPRYPVNVFGPKGWAMPTSFQAFVPRGIGPHDTYAYDVLYERTESISGETKRMRYTAKVEFQLRPDMRMTPDVRLKNREGLQVVSFSTTKDAGQ
jgi:hypothetical protein